jgi:hypothetical protein
MVVDLPETVGSQISSHFAGARRKADIVHGGDAGESFGDITKFEHDRSH